MKNRLSHIIILFVLIIGAVTIISCEKEKPQETIDYSFLNGVWDVIESNELASSGAFVLNDHLHLTTAYGSFSPTVAGIIWDCSRKENDCSFAANLDMENNKIYDIYGRISPAGSVPKNVKMEEEYTVIKLDDKEMVLNRTAPADNKGKVILKKNSR